MHDLYLGLMSGTSLDGIDAAIIDGATRVPHVMAARTFAFEPALRELLLNLALERSKRELEELGEADKRLGEALAQAALMLIKEAGLKPRDIRAIGSHGQTVRHRPDGPHPFTLQIGDPNILAERTGITTVADFRRRDMAAGGQGAPLVPAFHAACFRSPDEDRAVLNVGGMANLTLLPADPAQPLGGFDTGPGNVLLDAWTQREQGTHYDRGGAWAASGRPLPTLLDTLLRDPYFTRTPPKSTGREYFHLAWLERHLEGVPASPADIQATLSALTAQSVATALHSWAPQTRRVLVCGGGVHNTQLLTDLCERIPRVSIESTGEHGLQPDWIEAAAFAWMARETLAGRATSQPSVTGARAATLLGGIYPGGSGPLGLP
ncbi:MAG: anhydro-N-acetylmuramic acid kinase [Thiohalobacteraceae bacterium]